MDVHAWYEYCYKTELDYLLHKKYLSYKNSKEALCHFFSCFTTHIYVFICKASEHSKRQLIRFCDFFYIFNVIKYLKMNRAPPEVTGVSSVHSVLVVDVRLNQNSVHLWHSSYSSCLIQNVLSYSTLSPGSANVLKFLRFQYLHVATMNLVKVRERELVRMQTFIAGLWHELSFSPPHNIQTC